MVGLVTKKRNIKRAVAWSCFWISLAFIFNYLIYVFQGKELALEFLAGYLVEKSLSIDNVFIFFIVFSFFKIPPQYQRRVLFYGILAALVFRFVLIFLGVAILKAFFWAIYILGAFLLLTGLYVVFKEHAKINPGKNFIIRWIYRKFNVTPTLEGERFFLRKAGTVFITPLFLALLTIEGLDLLFALDSIPAVFGVTTNTMIIYTSNAFAVLGLRSLYFVVMEYSSTFQMFKRTIGLILSFIGLKILISPMYSISVGFSLGVIVALILTTALVSFYLKRAKKIH